MFPPAKGAMGAMGACRIRTTVPVDSVLREMGVGEQVGLHNRVCSRNRRDSEDCGSKACSSARPVAKEGWLSMCFPFDLYLYAHTSHLQERASSPMSTTKTNERLHALHGPLKKR
jgi:hypothetical protein